MNEEGKEVAVLPNVNASPAEGLDIQATVRRALAEDIGDGDVTTSCTVHPDAIYEGVFVAKASGILAGLAVAQATFAEVNQAGGMSLTFQPLVKDGTTVQPRDRIATVRGAGRTLLSAERTALNFLQRMSGIATLTRRYVDAVAGTNAKILDTRKTVPGLRTLDKLAVKLGGGQNHRIGLFDMVLIKENHVAAAGGITAAVERVRAQDTQQRKIEVEVRNFAELREALGLRVDQIMLDNMSLEEMRAAVELTAGAIPLEASGNVSLETVRAIAETGVDFISVGKLTHSVEALDISFLLQEVSQ
ncbi:MAG: carboxylating nicotinate-nucleotide diphosphorylase [Caldilineaceae bacterium]|nr:carboxylating nicotinate-nucleotide diphosphorylase [Caldilineaceae bacterium]